MSFEIRLEPCGCTVQQDHDARVHIEYCPKHKSAPDLYEALKVATTRIHNHIRYETGDYRVTLQEELKQGLAALAKAR